MEVFIAILVALIPGLIQLVRLYLSRNDKEKEEKILKEVNPSLKGFLKDGAMFTGAIVLLILVLIIGSSMF